ncbi:MAG: GNAT family N-acetyltransferase [Armatimonadetes bacterium]|nr:GNAT family N-acetyltransferase [Armatimonadota bacterium]
MMEVRLMRDDEKEMAYALASLAFMQGLRQIPWADDPNQPKASGYGVWDDRGFQAQAIVLSYRVHMGPDVVLPLGGIAGVACKPAARGRGYAKAALVRTLQHMRDEGEVVSTLYPFSWEFYQKLGWDWAGVNRRCKAATQTFEPAPDTDRCREASKDDRPLIEAAYRRFAGRYRGMLDRDEKKWNTILDHTPERWTYAYVYEGDEGVEGYLTYSGGSGESTTIREFICLSARAQRAMLGLLGRLDMQTKHVEWTAPADDLLWSAVCSYDVDTKLWPMTQARVVDVEGALGRWVPDRALSGRFVMRIADEHADWNDGVWEVEFSDGAVQLTRSTETPQLAMHIRAFSQAFFGTPAPDDLRRADMIEVRDEPGYAAFRDCLAGPIMWTNDFF